MNHHDKRKNEFGRFFKEHKMVSVDLSADFMIQKWKPKFINEVHRKVLERNQERKAYLLMIGSPNIYNGSDVNILQKENVNEKSDGFENAELDFKSFSKYV